MLLIFLVFKACRLLKFERNNKSTCIFTYVHEPLKLYDEHLRKTKEPVVIIAILM